MKSYNLQLSMMIFGILINIVLLGYELGESVDW